MGERQISSKSSRDEDDPAGLSHYAQQMALAAQSRLADILADARVWKLKDASAAPARPVWSTGKSSLDARLPGGGWPTASLIEVLLDDTGLGEVQLFLPALVEGQRRMGQDGSAGDVSWLV